MDAVLGLILDTLEAKQLTDVVNVIITSDHGMTNIDMNTRVCTCLNSPFDTSLSFFRSVCLFPLSSVQHGIYAPGKAHMRSIPSVRSFLYFAFQTVLT